MVHKFSITVVTTSEYVIEIDDEVMDEKFMAEFREGFHDLATLEEHAEQLAYMHSMGHHGFFEGYGHVKEDGHYDYTYSDGDPASGANIILIGEDIEIDAKREVMERN